MTSELQQLLDDVADKDATFRLTPEGKLLVHPRNRLGKALLKRIKKHRKEIRALLEAAAQFSNPEVETVILPWCWECGEIIALKEPCYELENLETGEKRPAHARDECMKALAGFFTSQIDKGEVWAMHHIHACGDEASGFDCVGGCFRER